MTTTISCTKCDFTTDIEETSDTNPTMCPECKSHIVYDGTPRLFAKGLSGTWAEAYMEDYSDASALMDALAAIDTDADQDWQRGITTWTFEDGSKIAIEGSEVTVL